MERLQHGKLLENQSGDTCFASQHHITYCVLASPLKKKKYYVIYHLRTYFFTVLLVRIIFRFHIMVRRRKSKSKDLRTGPRPFDKRDGKIKRWNTLEDIPMDEEDQCALDFCPHGLPDVKPYLVHASKDRILLEGEETGADDDGDEEEVFALKGIPSSENDEDEEDVYEEEDDDEDQPHPPARVRKGGRANAKPPPESDEEEQGSEEEEGWGRKKSAYYSSNAAELDSDDEEANELEEQEARRIQVKARDTMLDDDFGLADLDQDNAEDTEECVYHPLKPYY